jgi:hypothetical protein
MRSVRIGTCFRSIEPVTTSANDNLRSVTRVIAGSRESCWRALLDITALPAWVPGLRRARVIDTDEAGLPREILFEFSTSLTYTLVYAYDVTAREVRWEPRIGKRDGVRGFARLQACTEGTLLTYGLEQGPGRSAAELALGDPDVLVNAFARWVEARPPLNYVVAPV